MTDTEVYTNRCCHIGALHVPIEKAMRSVSSAVAWFAFSDKALNFSSFEGATEEIRRLYGGPKLPCAGPKDSVELATLKRLYDVEAALLR